MSITECDYSLPKRPNKKKIQGSLFSRVSQYSQRTGWALCMQLFNGRPFEQQNRTEQYVVLSRFRHDGEVERKEKKGERAEKESDA